MAGRGVVSHDIARRACGDALKGTVRLIMKMLLSLGLGAVIWLGVPGRIVAQRWAPAIRPSVVAKVSELEIQVLLDRAGFSPEKLMGAQERIVGGLWRHLRRRIGFLRDREDASCY
jgi:hypothetical protein